MSLDIQVTFVIPATCSDKNECPDEMLIAFRACEQHADGGLKAQWMREDDPDLKENLTKKDIFVFSEFKGELFKQLSLTKCLLVGPRCLSCCLTDGSPIPSSGNPVYTIAMRGLVVTASGLRTQIKNTIKQKVEWMGGTYNSALTDETTHLISNNVLSDKYIKSVEKGIPVMSETWVEAVWTASLTLDVSGTSSEFDTHRLPPFANLQITTSGLTKKNKMLMMKLVNENGGEFSGVFQSQTTDVLVLTRENVGSEKYKAAVEYGKLCVTIDWVKDSAERGCALPVSRYKISGTTTSSPIVGHRIPDMTLNFSRITKEGRPLNFVDESKAVDAHILSGSTKLSLDSRSQSAKDPLSEEIEKAFENFDMSLIKKAGPIFDGFCIWLTGLEGVSRDRASACISKCGGVRYDHPHSRVTHAVAGGGAAAAAAAAAPALPVLSPLWLLRSVRAARVLDEAEFLINTQPATPAKSTAGRLEAASPMSKRSLQLLLQGPAMPPPEPPQPRPGSPQDELVNHYLSQNIPNDDTIKPLEVASKDKTVENMDTLTTQPDDSDDYEQIFKGLVIEVQGLEDEAICEIGSEIRDAGGVLTASGSRGSHALVPLDFDCGDLATAGAEAVTVFWVKDCLSQRTLLPILYYHRPVKIPNLGQSDGPLKGVVASLSTYTGVERAFLDEVAKLLGATTQQKFSRRNTENAIASTHLICPEATGAKYNGAVKWGLPAVRASWLLACAAAGKRVSEREHLVGSSDVCDQGPPSPVLQNQPVTSDAPSEPPAPAPEPAEDEAAAPGEQGAPPAGRQRRRKPWPQRDMSKFEGMSPATRFIAMSRMGMFQEESVAETSSKENSPRLSLFEGMSPVTKLKNMSRLGMLQNDDSPGPTKKNDVSPVRTPPLNEVLSTPNLNLLSPTTRRRLLALKRGEMPSGPINTPTNPFEKNIPTPDSGFGAVLRPATRRMSVDARKRLWEVVADLPTNTAQQTDNQPSFTEICGNYLAQFNKNVKDDDDTPPSKLAKFREDQSAGDKVHAEVGDKVHSEVGSSSKVHEASGRSANSTISAEVEAQLQRLSVALAGRSTPRSKLYKSSGCSSVADVDLEPGPESQPNTVGWDDTTPAQRASVAETPQTGNKNPPPDSNPAHKADAERSPTDRLTIDMKEARQSDVKPCVRARGEMVDLEGARQSDVEPRVRARGETAPAQGNAVKTFILSSNVDNREEVCAHIAQLGGAVCSAEPAAEARATHVLCCAPSRSERVLTSVAAGRWVLHPAYVARSAAAGAFLPEEEYEWGNPLARCLPALGAAEALIAAAAHRWRRAREGGAPGPFRRLAALLHVPAPRRDLLARLLRAGGGAVVDQESPYSDETITVCFADLKRCPMRSQDRAWLQSRRVPVCAPVLLNAFLTEENAPNLMENCLPDFRY